MSISPHLNFKPKIPLQANILFAGNQTMRDIKAEIILTFVLELFRDYEKQNSASTNSNMTPFTTIACDEDNVIQKSVSELIEYISQNVFERDYLVGIFSKALSSESNMRLAKQIEPLGVYYDVLSKAFSKELQKGDKWIPELLGFTMINYYKIEDEKSFAKHDFIQRYDFTKLLSIYNKTSLRLKKEVVADNPSKKLWEIKTEIDKMFEVAEKIMKRYNEFRYKTNPQRISRRRRR